MNNIGTKAEIVLNHGHFQVKTPGDFVECSITGEKITLENLKYWNCLLYTSPSPRDSWASRMPSSAWKKKAQ